MFCIQSEDKQQAETQFTEVGSTVSNWIICPVKSAWEKLCFFEDQIVSMDGVPGSFFERPIIELSDLACKLPGVP